MNMIRDYAETALLVALCLLTAVFVALLIVRLVTWWRDRQAKKYQRYLKDALAAYTADRTSDVAKAYIPKLKQVFFSKRGVRLMGTIMNIATDEEQADLADMMKSIGYDRFLTTQLKDSDEKYIILVMRLVGLMKAKETRVAIADLLVKHQDCLDMQYLGLLALSQIGAEHELSMLATDPNYTSMLSFRSLTEILKAYSGNKCLFYNTALKTANPFARRLVLKRLGAEKCTEFADEVYELYCRKDISHDERIDVIRTLGELEYKPAEQDIRLATCDKDWHIRNVAYVALWNIAGDRAQDVLLRGLTDRQWWVRINTAKMLAQSAQVNELEQQVKELNDEYAYEAFIHAVRKRQIDEEAAK